MLTRTVLLMSALSLSLAACADDNVPAADASVPDAQAPDGAAGDVATADGSATDAVTDSGPSAAGAFVVSGALTTTPLGGYSSTSPPPEHHDFTLRFEPASSSRGVVVIGGPGWAVRADVASTDGQTFAIEEPLTLPLALTTACSAQASYSAFSFRIGPSGLTGTATGTLNIIEGDVGYARTAMLTMVGHVDHDLPAVMADPHAVDPLADLFFPASEPLLAETSAALVVDTTTTMLDPLLPAGAGVVTGFHKTGRALRYGATYKMTVSPGDDLAGNHGATWPTFTTVAAPALIAEDGFEVGTAATIGGAPIVDATFLPPLAGARSVLLPPPFVGALGLPPSNRFTARLAVNVGDRFVRATIRPVGANQGAGSTYGTMIRLATEGGTIVSAALPASEPLTVSQPLGPAHPGTTLWLGAARALEIALPADVGAEVIVDIQIGGQSFSCGLTPPQAGYQVDDLRVE